MSARRGIFVAPFDELADPRVLARLAASAEEQGFDGFFLWDHVNYRPPTSALADPWVAMSAIATATERMLIGPLVTPLSRRRVHKLARETVTLHLGKLRRLGAVRVEGGSFVLDRELLTALHERKDEEPPAAQAGSPA